MKTRIVPLLLLMLLLGAAASLYAFEMSGYCQHACDNDSFYVSYADVVTAGAAMTSDDAPYEQSVNIQMSWNCGEAQEPPGFDYVITRSENFYVGYPWPEASVALTFSVNYGSTNYQILRYRNGSIWGSGNGAGGWDMLSSSAEEWMGYCNFQGTTN